MSITHGYENNLDPFIALCEYSITRRLSFWPQQHLSRAWNFNRSKKTHIEGNASDSDYEYDILMESDVRDWYDDIILIDAYIV